MTKLLASAHDDVSGIELDEIARPAILKSGDGLAAAETLVATTTSLPSWEIGSLAQNQSIGKVGPIRCGWTLNVSPA